MASIEANILRSHRWHETTFVGIADYEAGLGPATANPSWPNGIAWSMSLEGSDEVLKKGMGRQHIEEMVSRVTALMLRRGATLYYAGNWTGWDGSDKSKSDRHVPYRNMLHMLLQSAASEQRWPERTSRSSMQSSNSGDWNRSAPVVNHLAWPHTVERRRQADWVSLCEVLSVPVEASGLPKQPNPDDAMHRAIAMSAMRRLQLDPAFTTARVTVPPVRARIAMHGKSRGYTGVAPGLLEECVLSWVAGHSLWLLGGFGGITKWMVDFLLWNSSGPAHFADATVASEWLRQKHPPLRALEHRLTRAMVNTTGDKSGPFTTWPLWSLDELLERLYACRAALVLMGPAAALRTGLSDDDTRLLMTTSDPDCVVRLLGMAMA